MIFLNCHIIESQNNQDNIFLNKNINRLLVDIGKTNYQAIYTDDFTPTDVILFAENIKLITDFIDKNKLNNRKCVAITQECYHETTENDKINYLDNEIFVYCAFNKKFYLNNFYYFYGVPNGKIDLSNKLEENYNTKLFYFGNLWRENWNNKYSLYYGRTKIAVDGFIGGYIQQIYSRDFYPINNYDDKYNELEKKINLIHTSVIKNISRDEKIKITQKLFYSLEFLSTDINNFTTERPFDAICSGCVPIFLGNDSLKKYFPTDSIIYIDEFNSSNECFEYVKNLKYDDWKLRMNKCTNIIFDITMKGLTGDNMIIQLFKNIVDDLNLN